MNERKAVARLRGAYIELATLHFDGDLPVVPIELSYRMRKQLARVETLGGRPSRLVMSAYHIQTHGWKAARETMLHELVHIWQATAGKPMHHDRRFREQAMRLGIEPGAKERLKPLRKRCRLK